MVSVAFISFLTFTFTIQLGVIRAILKENSSCTLTILLHILASILFSFFALDYIPEKYIDNVMFICTVSVMLSISNYYYIGIHLGLEKLDNGPRDH